MYEKCPICGSYIEHILNSYPIKSIYKCPNMKCKLFTIEFDYYLLLNPIFTIDLSLAYAILILLYRELKTPWSMSMLRNKFKLLKYRHKNILRKELLEE